MLQGKATLYEHTQLIDGFDALQFFVSKVDAVCLFELDRDLDAFHSHRWFLSFGLRSPHVQMITAGRSAKSAADHFFLNSERQPPVSAPAADDMRTSSTM